MAHAPCRGRLPGPAMEGSREGARFRVPQHNRDLVQGHVGVGQQVTGEREPDPVDNLLEGDALAGQMPAQGAVVHREQAGDLNRGAWPLQQLGLEHPAQVLTEAARCVARPRRGVPIASRCHRRRPRPAAAKASLMMSPVRFRLGRPGLHRHGIPDHSPAKPVRLIDRDVALTDPDIRLRPPHFASTGLPGSGSCKRGLPWSVPRHRSTDGRAGFPLGLTLIP
jgi:hypothetical protein